MKSRIKYLSLLALLILFFSAKVFSQEWNWEWGKSISNKFSGTWLQVQECDFMNNLYSVCPYDSILFMPDTTFHHPEQYSGYRNNAAILINNTKGEFVTALDLYTLPGQHIFHANVRTDQELNLYIACSFTTRMFVQDTIINHCNGPYPSSPDGLIMKLNNQYEVVWATLIGGTLQDDINEYIVDKNGDMFILSEQTASFSSPTTVSFFEQDTVFSEQDFTSISKLDKDGNMLWRNDFFGELSSIHLVRGADEQLYFWGRSYSDIIYNGDTIYNPYSSQYTSDFISIITNDGIVTKLNFFDFPVYPYNMVVNEIGEFSLTGTVYDTVILSQDTIIIPDDEYYSFIGKFDTAFQPDWYYIIPKDDNQQMGVGKIQLVENNLIFVASTDGDFQIADTIVSNSYKSEAFVVELTEDGDLVNIIKSETTHDLISSYLIMDNCNNPIISGYYQGFSYFGLDTLDSFSYYFNDGFISKLTRTEPEIINLGPDTIACEQYILTGPEEYEYYSWNNIITNQNWYTVIESGTYYFACSNEDGCWLYDTINIAIHPGFEINLGADTTIKENDTIIISIPDQYESYLWSDGSTSNTITIIGNEYGTGTFPIWVKVTDGPCIVADTIYLTIKSEFRIDEVLNNRIHIFPNPFNDKITIELKPDYRSIEIYDLNGIAVFNIDLKQSNSKSKQVELGNLTRGIYILKIKSKEQNLIKRIIKI